MVGGVLLVIFKERVQPYSCNPQHMEVIEVILYSLQVASVPASRLAAVSLFRHTRNVVIGGVAVGETIWHQQVDHV